MLHKGGYLSHRTTKIELSLRKEKKLISLSFMRDAPTDIGILFCKFFFSVLKKDGRKMLSYEWNELIDWIFSNL